MRASTIIRSLIAATSLLVFACGGPSEEELALSEELPSAAEIQSEGRALTPTRLCSDLELEQVIQQICPPIWCDPLGPGIEQTECRRTCVTDRQMVFNGPGAAGGGPTFTCETVGTECSAWVCDPCPTEC